LHLARHGERLRVAALAPAPPVVPVDGKVRREQQRQLRITAEGSAVPRCTVYDNDGRTLAAGVICDGGAVLRSYRWHRCPPLCPVCVPFVSRLAPILPLWAAGRWGECVTILGQ